ncbi:hypothetical protein MNBD_GAMMA22-1705 [hydrothermal vent metagenome]|uniref:ADP-heptose--lipooligosaccharide heptosyltransferase II n=1 Tax=hydrothermal vent metagenome TaxID=652676 RepID=A0A3B1A093_9ZZZZ
MQALKRILVARMGRVGDMVMITPALQAILDKFPHAKITLLTNADGKRTLNNFSERIDKIIIYDRKTLFPWLTRQRIKKAIAQDQYDRVYCFESKPSFLNLFSAFKPVLYALTATNDKRVHYAQYCLNLVEPNARTKMAYSLHLAVSKTAITDSLMLLKKLAIKNDDFIIGLHPSFSGLAKSFGRASKHAHHKTWPIAAWSALASKLQHYGATNNVKIKVMMDLIPDEESIAIKINKHSNGAALYQCPALNFERYKATLARYDLLITPDSGPMHIAAAVNTKIVALFSRHEPSDCQPFVAAEQFTVLRAEDMREPEKGLATIDVDSVFNACLNYLPK